MPALTHDFDLGGLRLRSGEGRKLQLITPLQDLMLGGERYSPLPKAPTVTLEVSKLTGEGYALKLAFHAQLTGACMRCLKSAAMDVEVSAREVDVKGGGEELSSPYVHEESVDLATWAHEALVLAAPVAVLCSEQCKGLCPECAADLNEVGDEHRHDRAPDPRWAKLNELKLE